jgi:hypothetical protein
MAADTRTSCIDVRSVKMHSIESLAQFTNVLQNPVPPHAEYTDAAPSIRGSKRMSCLQKAVAAAAAAAAAVLVMTSTVVAIGTRRPLGILTRGEGFLWKAVHGGKKWNRFLTPSFR